MQSTIHFFFDQTKGLPMSKRECERKKELCEDQILMLDVAQGSQSAMSAIIDKWKGGLFRFFDRSLRNKADAEDLTQRVFIRLYQSASRYQPRAKFSTYLFTVARNLLIDEIKKKNRAQLSSYDDEWINGYTDQQGDGVKEWQEILDFAMEGMPEYYTTAILLRVQRELSYREIANIMKVSESRVKTWIFRARVHLKESLEKVR